MKVVNIILSLLLVSTARAVDPNNCQIVFVLSAEDASHHKFTPVIEELAAANDSSGADETPYHIVRSQNTLRSTLQSLRSGKPLVGPCTSFEDCSIQQIHRDGENNDHENYVMKMKDVMMKELDVERAISRVCPDNGFRHIVIEDFSFSSSEKQVTVGKHQLKLRGSSNQKDADESSIYSHADFLNDFYHYFSPYADIQYVVLHRPFVEMIVSQYDEAHDFEKDSNTYNRALRSLSEFVDTLKDRTEVDPSTRKVGGNEQRLWTLICQESLVPNYHQAEKSITESNAVRDARAGTIWHLANFLEWTDALGCSTCFDRWENEYKNGPLAQLMGGFYNDVVERNKEELGGVWPLGMEDGLIDVECQF